MLSRIGTVLSRFGITSKRFNHMLDRYSSITASLGCTPTFAITAVTLARHPELIRKLSRQGVEFAVHGYIHADYGVLPLEEQVTHFKKAVDTFKSCQVPFTGFRAPFLHSNSRTPQAVSALRFPYDSSCAVHWGVIDRNGYTKESWHEYERLLDFYQSRKAQDYLVLPRSIDGFIEIPVSIPDDEAMVERLSITDEKEISKIWGAILQKVYERGELFTIQLHPERISYFDEVLAEIIHQVKSQTPPVWVATLGEIADWWNEKKRFTFEIDFQADNRYRVKTKCSDRATVLLKNCKVNVPVDDWFDGYQCVAARDFVLESPTRPVIGVSPDSSPAAIRFLQSEGYIVESSAWPHNYRVYLSNLAQFQETDEKPLSKQLEQSNVPLLRYWRWPDRARSALSITGDIDSITLIDFALRIYENWRQNRR